MWAHFNCCQIYVISCTSDFKW